MHRLVTHEELVEHVWAGNVDSDSAVRTHLHELRQVLGEGLIETVIGRGYRFTVEPTMGASALAITADREHVPMTIGSSSIGSPSSRRCCRID